MSPCNMYIPALIFQKSKPIIFPEHIFFPDFRPAVLKHLAIGHIAGNSKQGAHYHFLLFLILAAVPAHILVIKLIWWNSERKLTHGEGCKQGLCNICRNVFTVVLWR